MRRKRDYWRSFLDSLDTNGGHIVILLVLLFLAVWMLQKDWAAMDGKSMMSAALGALLMKFRPTGSSREQNAPTTTSIAQTTTTE